MVFFATRSRDCQGAIKDSCCTSFYFWELGFKPLSKHACCHHMVFLIEHNGLLQSIKINDELSMCSVHPTNYEDLWTLMKQRYQD